MAKRTTHGNTAAPGRNRAGNGSTPGNGESRPVLAVRTNDKGQVFSHIQRMGVIEHLGKAPRCAAGGRRGLRNRSYWPAGGA